MIDSPTKSVDIKTMNLFAATKNCFLAVVLALVLSQAWSAETVDNPLVGRWLVTRSGSRDTTKLPGKLEWEFTKDELIVRLDSQEMSRNRYAVDLAKKPPWVTVTIVDAATEVRKGIFRIVGDELHLKQTIGGGERPTEFLKDSFKIMKRQPERKKQP